MTAPGERAPTESSLMAPAELSDFLTSTLGPFGVRAGNDAHHGNIANPRDFPADRFFGEGEELLTALTPVVLNDVVPRLHEIPAKWNPGSFMVFALGVLEDGSSLRLHGWRQGIERVTPQGPNIHRHKWHLISRDIAGNKDPAGVTMPYRDTLFAWEEVARMGPEALVAEGGLLWLYSTRRYPGGRDTLETDGTLVRPIPVAEREVAEGDFNRMESGAVHLTDIPPEQLTVTLALDSPAFADTTEVLLGGSGVRVIERVRRQVDVSDAKALQEQILDVAA